MVYNIESAHEPKNKNYKRKNVYIGTILMIQI